MSLATHSNSNRSQVLTFLHLLFMLGLVLVPCIAHNSYYNHTNGKGSISSVGRIKGYGKGYGKGYEKGYGKGYGKGYEKGYGKGGGGSSKSGGHVKRSKAIRINDTSTVSDEPTAPPSKATCVVSSSTEARICLLLDSSGSIADADFDLGLNFSQGLVSAIDTTSPDSLYSIVLFADAAFIRLNYSDATTTSDELAQLTRDYGGTATDLGFEKCQETFDLGDGKSHVIIILTDGDPNDRDSADSVANATKATGTKIVCVGIGAGIDFDTLSRWSTIPELTFQTDSFTALENLTSSFTSTISCA